MNDIELLRRSLTEWYRKGFPWRQQPTLAMFAAKADKDVLPLVNRLIFVLGSDMEIQNLRLAHLLKISDPLAN